MGFGSFFGGLGLGGRLGFLGSLAAIYNPCFIFTLFHFSPLECIPGEGDTAVLVA